LRTSCIDPKKEHGSHTFELTVAYLCWLEVPRRISISKSGWSALPRSKTSTVTTPLLKDKDSGTNISKIHPMLMDTFGIYCECHMLPNSVATHLWLLYKYPRARATWISGLGNDMLTQAPLKCLPKTKCQWCCHLWGFLRFIPGTRGTLCFWLRSSRTYVV